MRNRNGRGTIFRFDLSVPDGFSIRSGGVIAAVFFPGFRKRTKSRKYQFFLLKKLVCVIYYLIRVRSVFSLLPDTGREPLAI